MTLRGRLITYLGYLASLVALITGCKTTNPIFQSSKDVSPFFYSLYLQSEEIDKKNTTLDEVRFEKLYPKFNLKGETDHLTKKTIDNLIKTLELFPKETIENIPNLDIILAMPTKKNQLNCESLKYDEAHVGGNFWLSGITFFDFSVSTASHEFTHAIHEYHPKKQEFEEKWNNLEVIVRGKKWKLKDIYGNNEFVKISLDGKTPFWNNEKEVREKFTYKYGFTSPYGASNILEDVATVAEFVLNLKRIYCEEYFSTLDEKAQLLVEYGFIKKKKYEAWKTFNSGNFGSYIIYPEKNIKELASLLGDENDEISIRVTSRILSDYEMMSKQCARKECLPFLKTNNRYVAIIALDYFLRMDLKGDYKKEVFDCIKKFNISEKNKTSYDILENDPTVFSSDSPIQAGIVAVDDKGFRKNLSNYIAKK